MPWACCWIKIRDNAGRLPYIIFQFPTFEFAALILETKYNFSASFFKLYNFSSSLEHFINWIGLLIIFALN